MSQARFFVCSVVFVDDVFFRSAVNHAVCARKLFFEFIKLFIQREAAHFLHKRFEFVFLRAVHRPPLCGFAQMLYRCFYNRHGGGTIIRQNEKVNHTGFAQPVEKAAP